mgnify:CR=1 FL=1
MSSEDWEHPGAILRLWHGHYIMSGWWHGHYIMYRVSLQVYSSYIKHSKRRDYQYLLQQQHPRIPRNPRSKCQLISWINTKYTHSVSLQIKPCSVSNAQSYRVIIVSSCHVNIVSPANPSEWDVSSSLASVITGVTRHQTPGAPGVILSPSCHLSLSLSSELRVWLLSAWHSTVKFASIGITRWVAWLTDQESV